jgi:hypothetical protein
MLELRGVAMTVVSGAVGLCVIFLVVVLVAVVVTAMTTVTTVMPKPTSLLATQYAAKRQTVQFQVYL